jgi:hypothetical protein
MRPIIPSLGSYVIGMFKESVLLEVITLPKIMTALDLGNQRYRFLEPMTLVGLRPDEGTMEVDGRSMWHMEKRGRTVPASEKYLRDMRRSVGRSAGWTRWRWPGCATTRPRHLQLERETAGFTSGGRSTQ